MNSVIAFILLTILVGCSSREVKEVTLQRVEDTERVFNPDAALPSAILDFHFAEYHFQEARFRLPAPIDYHAYMRITVKPGDIDRWISGLGDPYNHCKEFSVPWIPKTWWLGESEFAKLSLYETKT